MCLILWLTIFAFVNVWLKQLRHWVNSMDNTPISKPRKLIEVYIAIFQYKIFVPRIRIALKDIICGLTFERIENLMESFSLNHEILQSFFFPHFLIICAQLEVWFCFKEYFCWFANRVFLKVVHWIEKSRYDSRVFG